MGKNIFYIVLLLLGLPALLFIYQPSWQLGGWGMMLGVIGYTISPIILFGFALAFIIQNWRKD